MVANTRGDKVEGAYQALVDCVAVSGQIYGFDAEAELEAFRVAIQDEVAYGHQQIADALNNLGFNIDRKQVHNYREKLKLGRVTL